MAKNELLPFADGEDANVLPANQWEALTDILENGFQSGIARSEQVNRVLAQGAVASFVLGQLIVDQLNKDATLDKSALYQNLILALQENAKDACLPLSGGNVTGNLTVQSKNVVRSVNGTNADPSGNVAISVGGLSLVTSGTWTTLSSVTNFTVTGVTPYKPFYLVVQSQANKQTQVGAISGVLDPIGRVLEAADYQIQANFIKLNIGDGRSGTMVCIPTATSVTLQYYIKGNTPYYIYQ